MQQVDKMSVGEWFADEIEKKFLNFIIWASWYSKWMEIISWHIDKYIMSRCLFLVTVFSPALGRYRHLWYFINIYRIWWYIISVLKFPGVLYAICRFKIRISYLATSISLDLRATFIYLSLFKRLLCRLKVLLIIFILFISSRLMLLLYFCGVLICPAEIRVYFIHRQIRYLVWHKAEFRP